MTEIIGVPSQKQGLDLESVKPGWDFRNNGGARVFIQAREMNRHASAKSLGIQRQSKRQALALPAGLALYAEVPAPDWAAFHHQDLVT